jgi:tRNA threonylcarbamoyladenosine biosynthesis protein TsaB
MTEIVLAVDTTHEHGSIALCAGDALLEEREIHAPEGFGQVLFGEIEILLANHHVTLHDCHLFAGAAGPGSFTGVRIALTCVKGFAEVLGRPVIGVSNLEALAASGHQPRRAAIVDARKGEVYAAVYGPQPTGEMVINLASFLEDLPRETELISQDFAKLSAQPELFSHFLQTTAPRSQAAAMARIALHKWREGGPCDPLTIDANYIRRPEAEVLYRPPV